MKIIQYFSFLLFAFTVSCGHSPNIKLTENAVNVPVAGNTYVTQGWEEAKVSPKGIESWQGENAVLSTWFKLTHTGKLNLFLRTEPTATATFRITCLGKSFTVKMDNRTDPVIPLGTVHVETPGYVRVDIQGIQKEGAEYPIISDIILDGKAAGEPVYFVHDFEPYWGLRGPSVHLRYTLPVEEIEYFYNEITVPVGEDKIGSYFMANGFGEGYCGIQVNSPTERRILFSVWSPFVTDNPEDIPEDEKIRLLAKGEGVYTGEFGNEGSGGQSYLVYPWEPGIPYRFLTQVRPDGKGNTEYRAWFFDPQSNEWKIVAAFLRPKTHTWYTSPHSFLENFFTQQGYLERSVRFNNQWVRTVKGEWIELTEALFTYDATAKAEVRMDYAGGEYNGSFFLKNGGFFNDNTEYNSISHRSPTNRPPDIKLPL